MEWTKSAVEYEAAITLLNVQESMHYNINLLFRRGCCLFMRVPKKKKKKLKNHTHPELALKRHRRHRRHGREDVTDLAAGGGVIKTMKEEKQKI